MPGPGHCAARAARSAQADVSRYEECEAAARISDELGPATILINNVGISPKTDGARSRSEMPPAEWDRVVSVNPNSAFYMTRLATPHMVARRQGRVINMSSVAGKAYDIVAAHYAATKAALIGPHQRRTRPGHDPHQQRRHLAQDGGRALKVWEMPPAEWDRVVSVNLNSAFYMTRLATPHMVARAGSRHQHVLGGGQGLLRYRGGTAAAARPR